VTPGIHLRPDVKAALQRGDAVVALESTLIAHGLPRPRNLDVARRIEEIVVEEGAVPATVAVVAGRPTVGLNSQELALIASSDDVPKLGVRDLPACVALESHGATTVASTAHLAGLAGIAVFATGGLGGVHREARRTWDESADLVALSTTPVLVVCAGVKSILDVGATLERLESLSVPVVGYGTHTFPGFYLSSSGHELAWSVADPKEAARVFAARASVGVDHRGMVLAVPVPDDQQLDPALHDRVLQSGLEQLAEQGVTGAAVTPFLLEHFHTQTAGASLEVNVAIIEHNARIAARIAVALAG
jgi:pseudouridylate synthase